MKNKRTYSLTARERKELRRAAEAKEQKIDRREEEVKPKPEVKETARESSERIMISSQKQAKRRSVLISGVICIAVILILVALIAPAVMFIVNPYRGYNHVIARFNLSNGMRLEYVIEEEDYDTAATNFIFLAKNGYFDNTVFYDAQNGWLRFGGYEAQPNTNYTSNDFTRTHHHKDNEDFYRNFSAIPNERMYSETTVDKDAALHNKFGYRLKADTNGRNARKLEEEGVLAYLYSDTATEFQFAYKSQATNQINSLSGDGSQTTYDLNPTRVGYAFNDETIENLKSIATMAERNLGMTTGYMWMPPTPDIKIVSVKVFNLDGKKWNNFSFIDYMRDKNAISQWIGVV